MPRGNPNPTKNDAATWCFRVCGKNRDGKMVTLGRYRTETEANANCNALVEEGYYQGLKVLPIEPRPAEPAS